MHEDNRYATMMIMQEDVHRLIAQVNKYVVKSYNIMKITHEDVLYNLRCIGYA